jgi:methylmalonyl-CoA/ethylmalonyl-CoA epimerase
MAEEFLGIDHLGVVVQDLAEAEATYRDILGFTVSGGETLPERGLEVRFVETGNSRIELIAPTREDSEVSGFLHKRGEGIHHICVRVANIEQAIAKMKERGARLINDTPQPGAHGTRVAFIHPKGTHGVLMELVEHPRDSQGH